MRSKEKIRYSHECDESTEIFLSSFPRRRESNFVKPRLDSRLRGNDGFRYVVNLAKARIQSIKYPLSGYILSYSGW